MTSPAEAEIWRAVALQEARLKAASVALPAFVAEVERREGTTTPLADVAPITESRSYTVDAKHKTFLLGSIETALSRIKRGDLPEFALDAEPEGATCTITLTWERS